jgi:hypothetical protein
MFQLVGFLSTVAFICHMVHRITFGETFKHLISNKGLQFKHDSPKTVSEAQAQSISGRLNLSVLLTLMGYSIMATQYSWTGHYHHMMHMFLPVALLFPLKHKHMDDEIFICFRMSNRASDMFTVDIGMVYDH